MTVDSSTAELNHFLAGHESVARPRMCEVGSLMGEWRITAFLGSGGNAEVYRVVREPDGMVAAAKILLREDEASRKRFRQEASLLSSQMGSSFAKFYASGETDGRLYIVSELLEPVDLPTTENEIEEYLLAVCRAVGRLHKAGLVHRDIKPSNIMRRANGELVLIDLGLVKDEMKSPEAERDVSIVSGKVIAVGTPRFAAPEQMTGGRVTAAADIHAIGRLADVAFNSNPPRSWLPIIRRATSSIPEQRYKTTDYLARAIRRRNHPRRFAVAAGVAAAVAIGVIFASGKARAPLAPQASDETRQWASLCSNGTTNVVDMQLVSDSGDSRVFKKVPRSVEATFVRLNNATNTFHEPLVLSAKREYFIEGPGILTADIRAPEHGATVHLRNCFVVNRSSLPLKSAGIRYVFDRGAYLDFPLVDEPDRATFKAYFSNYDAAFNDIRFGGPETPRGLKRRRHEDQLDQMRRAMQSFSKNFHFPRHILASGGKYLKEELSVLGIDNQKPSSRLSSGSAMSRTRQ